MFERNSEKHVCRICGAAVQKDRKICDCCEESFALCDLDNLLNTKTAETNGENRRQTLLKNRIIW